MAITTPSNRMVTQRCSGYCPLYKLLWQRSLGAELHLRATSNVSIFRKNLDFPCIIIDMTPSKRKFIARLQRILGPRKRHSWGAELGFTNNRIHRLFKESEPLPSTEELALIGEAENLSLNWLVYEIGPMYRVQNYHEASEFNFALENLLPEERSILFLVVNQEKCAIIASKGSTYEYKSKPISIRKIHCLIGPGSSIFQPLLQEYSIVGIELPTDRFKELESGELGTYALFGDRKTQGLLETSEEQNPQLLIGNMPLAIEHLKINLNTLISCYNRIQAFEASIGQTINEKKFAELTWVMYSTEMNKKHRSVTTQTNLERASAT